MKNKLIKKISINTSIITGVLLGSYILCNNPIKSKETLILSSIFTASTSVYIKKRRNNKKY